MTTNTDEPIHVLLLLDDEVEHAAVRRALAAGAFAVVGEHGGAAVLFERAREPRHDVIVMGETVGGAAAAAVVHALRQAGVTAAILAIARDEAGEAALIAAGATDALVGEDAAPARLPTRVRHAHRVARAEHAANTARRLLADVVRELPSGVALVDPAARAVVLANPIAETLLGERAAALLDDARPDGAELRALIAEAEARGARAVGATLVEHGGRWYRASAAPIGGAEPRPILLDLQDVTDEATARVSAEKAARRRAEILAIVSHDLRGPLNAIGIALEVLKDDAIVGEKRARYVAATRRSIDRADRMITDLMTAAQIEAGTLRLDPVAVAARWLLEQARRDHELVAGKSGMTITVGDVEDVMLRADRERVVQALGNLIQNALRHATGTPEITLTARRSSGSIELSVRDRGPGVPPDAVPHLFDRYWQGSDRRGGAGLGLAIVRGIARAHGGDARVGPAAGGGAEFTIVLPT